MNVNLAVQYLKQGRAVVFPTDTAYALGVDATSENAVKRLFKIKKRKPSKPVHVVVSGLAMAKKYAKFTPAAEKLFKKFMPGPLTIILPLNGRGSAYELLSAGTGTIGIRMPKNKIALALVKKLGKPITATSANVSSAPTAYSVSQINWQYRNEKHKPDLVPGSGKLKHVMASTMVKLTDSRISIIRRGPITKKEIERTLTKPR